MTNMEAEQLKYIMSKDVSQTKTILTDFNTKNADLLKFENFHTKNEWHDLWIAVFDILNDNALSELHTLCLNTVRILTRDKFSLQQNYIENELTTLLRLAQLNVYSKDTTITSVTTTSNEQQNAMYDDISTYRESYNCKSVGVTGEALKCLCNLVYQSPDCLAQCLHHQTVDAIVKRVASTMRYPCTLEYYDMKLLFLLTALDPIARSRLQIDLNGVTYITKWLDDKLSELSASSPALSVDQINIICELLKVMFNITKSPNEYEIQGLHLTVVIREMLLRFSSLTTENEIRVVTHAINLLTNLSSSCLAELTFKCSDPLGSIDDSDNDVAKKERDVYQANCFEGRNVCALKVIIDYLRQALDKQDNEATKYELISPVLTVLVKCARCDRIMRHYLRKEVLPPLRDVSQRPEMGNTLRNHLCRFLTVPTMMRDLSSELIFVLCKENVGRMVKYTGYGNAAGLFAKRGLLDCRQIKNNEYSSDSDDSDTEEYKQQHDNINPILGCLDSPKHNLLNSMSEEQKEYEAIQLVALIDKLHKSGIVQPCRIDDDGKPQPLEHILQLQDELPQQKLEQTRKS